MSKKPVLVIQPRRLGDLILTFPLLIDLRIKFPGRPIWVAAEPAFFEPLMPFAPSAVFFPVAHLPRMASQPFEAVINLGAAPDAARLAWQCQAELKLGRLQAPDRLLAKGFWQLYREGLTQANRHNGFHWADLFRLDLGLPFARIQAAAPKPAGSGRIGLFIGASEPAKRPLAPFWAQAANQLAGMGLKPILLGGPGEAKLGAEIMASGAKAVDFCAKTNLAQLAGILKTLDLLITPDTGPMHLANWLGAPVLNLSMGNVSAAETGPFASGQLILRANMSCSGCWQCGRGRLWCREEFKPREIAKFAAGIIHGQNPAAPANLELLRASRDGLGLYRLEGGNPASLRPLLEEFWKAAFLYFSDARHEPRLRLAAAALGERSAKLAASMRDALGKLLACLLHSGRRGQPLPKDFLEIPPLHSRLLAGFLLAALQNGDYANAARAEALARLEALRTILAEAS